tara:strand:+ start:2260 stop:2637 length:378 start_codon:yes stop_codon:yes gene_type:complete
MAGLLEKQSLFDRHNRNELGNAVGTAAPSAGNYFAGEGQSINSPFVSETGDHMVDLLTGNVTTENVPGGMTYLAAPSLGVPPAHFQDLHPGATDTFSGQPVNSALGQFGGPYINQGPCTTGGGLC